MIATSSPLSGLSWVLVLETDHLRIVLVVSARWVAGMSEWGVMVLLALPGVTIFASEKAVCPVAGVDSICGVVSEIGMSVEIHIPERIKGQRRQNQRAQMGLV